MDKKKEIVCKLMEFVDETCHWIRKPNFEITPDINIEFEFHQGRKVCSFPKKFKSIMFTVSKPSLFEKLDVVCFSEENSHNIYVDEVKFFRFSSFGRKIHRFLKKYHKLYEEQEWMTSEVALRDLLFKMAFCPNWVSKPGETIVDYLEEKNKTIKDLSLYLNRSEKFVHQLIEADIYISPIIAIGLGTFFGNSAMFWYAREFHYRSDLKRMEKENNGSS